MMTREEIVTKIAELNKQLEELDRKIGFENDEIFLLSIEEYKRYKGDIPELKTWWWLRSAKRRSPNASGVNRDGSVGDYGFDVYYDDGAVRPALKYSNLKSIIFESEDSDYFTWNRVIWKIIDRDSKIAISLTQIDFKRFDIWSNDYCSSKIRGWLLDWYKSGVDN